MARSDSGYCSQVKSPFQGRMFANFRLLNFGFAVVGTVIGGSLGSVIGFRETLIAAVGLMYLSVAVLVFSPVLRVKKVEPAVA